MADAKHLELSVKLAGRLIQQRTYDENIAIIDAELRPLVENLESKASRAWSPDCIDCYCVICTMLRAEYPDPDAIPDHLRTTLAKARGG